jgi:hypothetical protein
MPCDHALQRKRPLGEIMDTKLYVEWRETLGKWIVKYQGRVISQHDTQAQAQKWVEHNYPSHAYETERVQVRENSPRGAKRGEWHK